MLWSQDTRESFFKGIAIEGDDKTTRTTTYLLNQNKTYPHKLVNYNSLLCVHTTPSTLIKHFYRCFLSQYINRDGDKS